MRRETAGERRAEAQGTEQQLVQGPGPHRPHTKSPCHEWPVQGHNTEILIPVGLLSLGAPAG